MGRWEPNSRERLRNAALELFAEQGFAETTVPEITARAGLTTRTFFRHFADKREVLFAGEVEPTELVARLFAEAPATLTPMELIEGGLAAVGAELFEGEFDYLTSRHAVIQSDAGLRERELQKLAGLSAAIRQGFLDRGVDDLTSTLMSQLTVTVVNVSVGRWLTSGGAEPLATILHETLDALRAVTAR
jgi:AcrR family transcriptional regulator